MKAAVIFCGNGPILILTSYESLDHPNIAKRLQSRGICKYIAREVSVDKVKERYGKRFLIVHDDLSNTNDVRLMDLDGPNVFKNFSLENLGAPVYSKSLRRCARGKTAEEATEAEWLYVKIDEFGKLVESTYMPMLDSCFAPPLTVESSPVPMRVRLQITLEGIIFDWTHQIVKGRKLIRSHRSSRSSGESNFVTFVCIWRPNINGDWICS